MARSTRLSRTAGCCLALLALLPLSCLGIADVDVEATDSNYMLGQAVADSAKAVIKHLDGSHYVTEAIFNKYLSSIACQQRGLMVCKSCAARDMERVTFTATEQGYQVWCFEAGRIENLGDGGTPNWRFAGCLEREGEKVVRFKSCRDMQ